MYLQLGNEVDCCVKTAPTLPSERSSLMLVHNEVQQGTCVIFATSLFVSHTAEAKLVYGDCLCVCVLAFGCVERWLLCRYC
jgi:hypothetical protein